MFSILIPTFNIGSTISNVLDSIASQTYKDYEVIIIDARSTDNTIDVIKKYLNRCNIRWISETDTGIYDAMNKGIQLATGKWLYFIGGDDKFINESVLENISSHIKDGDQLIYGNVLWMPSGVRERGEWGYSRFLKININHQRIFYHADLFKKYGNFNTLYKVESDHELNIRFFCNKFIKKKYVDIDIAYYNETGFSANKIDEKFWDNWKDTIHKKFSPFLSQKEIYGGLSWYCWYNIRHKKYKKAFKLFCSIFFRTADINFLKHTLSQVSKTVRD